MKRILDTVHGYILVKDEYVRNIVDTRYFQRLRRVEQTSIRAVYPSARHDRFIHSLGVYHIGSMIVDHLKNEAVIYKNWEENDTTIQVVMESYLAACLLHDIAHAPFSHSFESYYGSKVDLAKMLMDEIDNDSFRADMVFIRKKDDPAHHEYMSAYVAYREYGEALRRMNLDAELVARMITGVFYSEEKETHQIHNCMISLLHGNVIDADRLDYACRDVWASGYSTSSIDIRRLITALHIRKFNDDYVVCFDSNSLNEIEGVLNVKDFQVKYVLNHHSVSYEQWLLKQAAEHMALVFFPLNKKELSDGEAALRRMINKQALIESVQTRKKNYVIRNISDDDLIFMIKQDTGNPYYNEWASRNYTHYPLWKSPDEFYHFFPEINRSYDLRDQNFEQKFKELLQDCHLDANDIIVTEAKYKPRVKLDSLLLCVAEDIVRYTTLYPQLINVNKEVTFYYVFIPKNGEGRDILRKRVKKYIDTLRPIMRTIFNFPKPSSLQYKINESLSLLIKS